MSEDENDFEVYTRPKDRQNDDFIVELPHQCDAWVVARGSREDAVEQLRGFIADAQAALVKLETIEPCSHDWQFEEERLDYPGIKHRFWCAKCESFGEDVVREMTLAEMRAEVPAATERGAHIGLIPLRVTHPSGFVEVDPLYASPVVVSS